MWIYILFIVHNNSKINIAKLNIVLIVFYLSKYTYEYEARIDYVKPPYQQLFINEKQLYSCVN